MVSFIDDHREEYGVEPICKVLPIAPSTYYAHKARESDPSLRPARAQRDEQLREEVQRVWKDNFEVYGVRKVWRQLNREGHLVARCTVARLMSALGLFGAVRGRHRLNRGGNRQANAALYRIVIVRLRWHQPTIDYVARRTAEGLTKKEIIRCLKRYVAREVFHLLPTSAKQDTQDLAQAA